MTPLPAKYIRDLVIRGRSKHTLEAYTRYVRDLAGYYRRSPELISYEEVTDWLYHLIKERQLSASSVNIAVSAVRFLYAVTLGRETLDLMASVPHMKRATPRAEVYARSEVEAILTALRQPRDRVLLMTVYGCGLHHRNWDDFWHNLTTSKTADFL
jgi:integrase/recombinase XerD